LKRSVSLRLSLLAAVALGTLPRGAVAQRPNHAPPPIALTYRGGPLLPNVRVVTLFWGADWSGSQLPEYFNSFFRTLFADGRYIGNLAQYSASGFQLGNGTLGATATDSQEPPRQLRDARVQLEIRAQVAAGHLPAPDENTVYVVFTPPGVEVFDRYGDNSVRDFYSYHDYAPGSDGFPYISMPYDDTANDPRLMTVDLSHELAEVVTDPGPTENQLGWYDDYYGEIADIVDTLYNDGRIGDADYTAELKGSDGSVYVVEKFWSLKANAPVAF
jgi:hypothetical protein